MLLAERCHSFSLYAAVAIQIAVVGFLVVTQLMLSIFVLYKVYGALQSSFRSMARLLLQAAFFSNLLLLTYVAFLVVRSAFQVQYAFGFAIYLCGFTFALSAAEFGAVLLFNWFMVTLRVVIAKKNKAAAELADSSATMRRKSTSLSSVRETDTAMPRSFYEED